MKINHCISVVWATICLMAAALTACSDHDINSGGASGGDGSDKLQLGLNVVIPSMPGSRASYEQGVGDYENTVDLAKKDYRILLFTHDTNTLLANFDPEKIVMIENRPSSSNPTYRSYRLYAEVDKDIKSYADLKLVVLANWGDYPDLTIGLTTIDDLAGYAAATGAISSGAATTFEGASKLVGSDGKHIPMFGVKDCAGIKWANFDLAWLGDLWLLRAVAKIEVRAAEGGAEIESVELSRYNKLGTCAPMRVYREADYVMGEDQYKAFDYLTLPGGKNDPAEASYAVQPDADGLFTVYVPEYQILADPSKPKGDKVSDYARLYVKFKGNTKIYPVDFKYYTADAAADNDAAIGDFFDIKRNFYYRYRLRMSEGDPEIRVDVLPYRAVELKPDFGLPLKDLTLNRYVVHLFTDLSGAPTTSSETVIAYDEHGKQIPASEIEWTLDSDVANHVCTVEENAAGECVIKPIAGKRGRDVLTATIRDHNGMEVTAECVVEVSERLLGLDKTFLGLTPRDNGLTTSTGSFIADIIAETDDRGTLSWELLNEDDLTPSNLDVEVIVAVNGRPVDNGSVIGSNDAEVRVNAGLEVGTAHLWLYYDGPDPDNPSARKRYTTYCEILVQNIAIVCEPKAASVIVGQSMTLNTSVLPKFSNFIPTVKYHSLDPSVATVDNNGLVTGITPGSVRVEAYNDTDFPMRIADTVFVSVKPNNLVLMRQDGVTVADYIELLNGEKASIRAMSNGRDISKSVKWSIEGEVFCTVKNGVVTGSTSATKGTSTIVATYDFKNADGTTTTLTARCIVVVAKQRILYIDTHPHAVSPQAEVPLRAYIFPDSIPWDKRTYTVNWSSNNTKVIAFDNAESPANAVAKSPGKATLTASVKYGSTTHKATTEVEVLGAAFGEEGRKGLFVYDASGTEMAEITTPDGSYTHEQITAGAMSSIKMPRDASWVAKIGVGSADLQIADVDWQVYRRYEWYDPRINLTVSKDKKSCTIKNIATDDIPTRYNEVIVTIKYSNGQTETRRFAVFSY